MKNISIHPLTNMFVGSSQKSRAAKCIHHTVSASLIIKRPARDACLCMGDLQAPPAPAAPHFVFLITL